MPSGSMLMMNGVILRSRHLLLSSAVLLLLGTSLLAHSGCCLPTRLRHGFRISPNPIWTTDLRPLGYYHDRLNPPGVVTAVRQIAFGSDKELVVISDQGSLPRQPNRVRAYVLDADTGRIVRQENWDSHLHPYIFPTAAGNYVVNTLGGIRLYSHGLEGVLKTMNDSAQDASPDGRSITVWDAVPGHAVTRFLDADTLEPTGAEFINKAVDSIGFNRIVYIGYLNRSPNASVFVDDVSEDLTPYDTTCKEIRPRFVSNDVLAVFGCGQITLVTVQGKVLFTTEISEAKRWVAPASRNGRRFALVSTYESAADWSKTCFERVDVFDLVKRDFVFKAEVRACRGTEGESGTAISPEGRFLAVNSQGLVQMFLLPSFGEGPVTSSDVRDEAP